MKTELPSLKEIKSNLKSPEFYKADDRLVKNVLQCLISWDWGLYEYTPNYITLGDGKMV